MSRAIRHVPAVISSAVLLLAACLPKIESMRTTPVPLEARPAGHPIRLYFTTRPRCPYEEIAMLAAGEQDLMRYPLRSDQTAELLRARARQLGGDAIIGLGEVIEDRGVTTTHTVSRTTTGDSTASQSTTALTTDVTPNRTRHLQGTVVRFTRDDCRD
jgi:hypothetical protein